MDHQGSPSVSFLKNFKVFWQLKKNEYVHYGKIQTLWSRCYLCKVDNKQSKPPIISFSKDISSVSSYYIYNKYLIIIIIHTIYVFGNFLKKSSLIFFFYFFFPLRNISWTSFPFRYLILFSSCIWYNCITLL